MDTNYVNEDATTDIPMENIVSHDDICYDNTPTIAGELPINSKGNNYLL